MENEQWEAAMGDLRTSLQMKQALLKPDDRELAHLHYRAARAALDPGILGCFPPLAPHLRIALPPCTRRARHRRLRLDGASAPGAAAGRHRRWRLG